MLQDELAKALSMGKSQLSKLKARGCPVDDLGKAKTWIATNIKPRGKRVKSSAATAPVQAGAGEPVKNCQADTSFTPEARLERANRIEVAIYQAAARAVDRNEHALLSSLISSYGKALTETMKADREASELRLQSGELIHRESAQVILSDILQPIRTALDLLPTTERSRCNPNQPATAEKALRAWKDALLKRLCDLDKRF